MEKAGVDSEVAKLDRLAKAHASEQRRLTKLIASAPGKITRLKRDISEDRAGIDLREDISGDAFRATINGVICEKRVDAGERIKGVLVDAHRRVGETVAIGTLAGLDLVVAVEGNLENPELHLQFPHAPIHTTVILPADIDDEHPVGLVSRLTNRLWDLEERLANETRDLENVVADVDQAEEMIGTAFDQAGRLATLRARQAEITEALMPKPIGEATPTVPHESMPEIEPLPDLAAGAKVGAGSPPPRLPMIQGSVRPVSTLGTLGRGVVCLVCR